MNKTSKEQLIDWQKNNAKQEKRKKRGNKKCKSCTNYKYKKETLSQRDLLVLIGVNRPTFAKKKGRSIQTTRWLLMYNWADELIQEYTNGRKQLINAKQELDVTDLVDSQDMKQINSMIDSLSYSIEWMEKGRQPGTFRGADKRAIYQRQYVGSMDFIPDIVEQLEPKRLYMTKEEKIILSDILASFSVRERQCYLLHVAQGLSMGKIAKQMGISKSTVQTHISRAKRKVKERFQ